MPARFPEVAHPSPNGTATPIHERLGVCLHHSVCDYAAAITRLTDPASRVSYHVLIAPNGERCRFVPDDQIAWHAGVSTWRGRHDGNNCLLGLAFAGDTYRDPLTDAQLASAQDWLATRISRYQWAEDALTDHRQIAPGRKDDLNPTEWARCRALWLALFVAL